LLAGVWWLNFSRGRFRYDCFTKMRVTADFAHSALRCDRQTESRPTATEIFHLRSECVNLAEKIREQHSGKQMVVAAWSHYDPRKNRCFVYLSSFDGMSGATTQTLYDGQTGDDLASTLEGGGYRHGSVRTVWMKPPLTRTDEADFKATEKFMEEAMGNDNPGAPYWPLPPKGHVNQHLARNDLPRQGGFDVPHRGRAAAVGWLVRLYGLPSNENRSEQRPINRCSSGPDLDRLSARGRVETESPRKTGPEGE
jgi:hypothetical protein